MIARIGPGEELALAFVDLDDFKRVNDLHGHATGDALLKEIASRIRAEIREEDALGRISGDEFIVAIRSRRTRAALSSMTERLKARLADPFHAPGIEIPLSASIGVAIYPHHGMDYETLRRHADLAMYRAKTIAKGNVTFFTQELGREAAERMDLEHRLTEAVQAREFRCALQKKTRLRDGSIVGFEALARWVDRSGRVHPPGRFLPVAIELGLVNDITMLIIDDLIGHICALDRQFSNNIRYSINISPAQINNIAFMNNFLSRLDYGKGYRFTIEITEESLSDTRVFEARVRPLLREAGIGLSIDDFGTGYSSLSQIATLTADELKIDRSLVTGIHDKPRNQVILKAVESLACALEMSIVAEGIETEDERGYLLEKTRIGIGQGFLFHKPQLLGDILGKDQGALSPDRGGRHRARRRGRHSAPPGTMMPVLPTGAIGNLRLPAAGPF